MTTIIASRSIDGRAPLRVSRRLVALAAGGFCASATGILPAKAEYPSKPIVMLVPFAAGGGTDTIARIVSDHMAKTLGQPIVIENAPGAGGTTATVRAARATADGYTIMIGHMGTHGAAPALYADLKYNPAKDFTPIGQTAGHPVLIVTKKDFPASNLKEFVDYVQKNQDKVNEAHAGVGSASHANCTLLQSLIGTKTARVAYRGIAPAVNDLVGGQVDFGCLALSSVISQIQAGTIKAMAIASPARADAITNVPTTTEAGLPEFQLSFWNAIFAPASLPQEIRAKLTDAAAKALDDTVTRKRLLDVGCVIPDKADRTPMALQQLVEKEVRLWGSVLQSAGIAPK